MLLDIEDEFCIRFLHAQRVGQEIAMDRLGDEWKGYVCRIVRGDAEDSSPVQQPVRERQRLTLERKCKGAQGCTANGSLNVMSLVIVKKGDGDFLGITDTTVPCNPLPSKQAARNKKRTNVSKEKGAAQRVVREKLKKKEVTKGASRKQRTTMKPRGCSNCKKLDDAARDLLASMISLRREIADTKRQMDETHKNMLELEQEYLMS
ncbi:40S ribosomal protein S6-like isoform X2 [Paramacrobiotus metropolitanus]|nr:40S ribosomal protein S6-like isoform X2 [Paramacrobiotus metropolitanus]